MRIVFSFIVAIMVMVTGFSAIGQAAAGYSNTSLKVRAGPGSDYPVVYNVDSKMALDVRACTKGYKWCEVSVGRVRGWVPEDQLRLSMNGKRVLVSNYGERMNIPVVGFQQQDYWTRNYKDRDFYRNEAYWNHNPRDNGYYNNGSYNNNDRYDGHMDDHDRSWHAQSRNSNYYRDYYPDRPTQDHQGYGMNNYGYYQYNR